MDILSGLHPPQKNCNEEVFLASRNPKKPAGRKKFRETRHPVYRGVRQRNSGKWVCEVREPNKKSRIWLGTFPTVDMAARAHDVAAIALHGRLACLNFADSAWRLRIPVSADSRDIQKAATEAAEAFRPGLEKCRPLAKKCDDLTAENKVFCSGYEDEVFGIQSYISDMASGLLMLPPPIQELFDVEFDDLSLWSYSI